MYYRLETEESLDCGYLQRDGNQREGILFGQLWNASELVIPFPFTIVADPEEGLNMNAYYANQAVMSKAMVDVLVQSGVSNLQVFPALITHSLTGESIDDYVVVNIIGLVACAALSASDATPYADVHYFHRLAIDPGKTRGALMFRLAESMIDVVVAEPVAEALRAGNFRNLVLEPLEEVSG